MSPQEKVIAKLGAYLEAGNFGSGPGDRAAQREEFLDTMRAESIPDQSIPTLDRAISDRCKRLAVKSTPSRRHPTTHCQPTRAVSADGRNAAAAPVGSVESHVER